MAATLWVCALACGIPLALSQTVVLPGTTSAPVSAGGAGTCSAANFAVGQQCGGNFSSTLFTCADFNSCQNTAWAGACCLAGTTCQPVGTNNCWSCGGAMPTWLTSAPPAPSICTAKAGNGDYDYACVLAASMLFYEAQRSGRLPATNRIQWRGNAGLQDVASNGQPLVGGWYDAGDNNKFLFPAAWTVATLALGLLEFPEGYQAANQTAYALANIRWGADFLAAARFAPNSYVAAVLSPAASSIQATHAFWNRPEDGRAPGLTYELTNGQPGADLLGAAAAGLAAASVAFQASDPGYSASLLAVAQDLYSQAQASEGLYSDAILVVNGYYQSFSFLDDLAWAAAWLARRTGDATYLLDAQTYFDRHMQEEGGGDMKRFDFNNVIQGAGYLLAKLVPGEQDKYTQPIRTVMNKWLQATDGITYSPQGLAVVDPWGNLRYVSNQALMGLLHNKLYPGSQRREQVYTCFAHKQMRYILGDTGRSYVAGVGAGQTPCQVHHRAASCGPLGTPCDCLAHNNPGCNPNTIYGALVSGPDAQDGYRDVRFNYEQTEVAVDFNAGFSGVMAALVSEPITWAQCESAGLANGRGDVSANNPSAGHAATWHAAILLLSTATALAMVFVSW